MGEEQAGRDHGGEGDEPKNDSGAGGKGFVHAENTVHDRDGSELRASADCGKLKHGPDHASGDYEKDSAEAEVPENGVRISVKNLQVAERDEEPDGQREN